MFLLNLYPCNDESRIKSTEALNAQGLNWTAATSGGRIVEDAFFGLQHRVLKMSWFDFSARRLQGKLLDKLGQFGGTMLKRYSASHTLKTAKYVHYHLFIILVII